MRWRIHHAASTHSTNLDARQGVAGDVYTADFQTAGRGRLDHVWLSPPGTNLMMSALVDVAGLPPTEVCTFPLVVGFSVAEALAPFVRPHRLGLKWPNDVWVDARKICGILCERMDDVVIAGIGVNVGQTAFPPELADRATSLGLLSGEAAPSVATVRDAVLDRLAANAAAWRTGGLDALYDALCKLDVLRGRTVGVFQTEQDAQPVRGICGGIRRDGTLDVGGVAVCAGEAHVDLQSFDRR